MLGDVVDDFLGIVGVAGILPVVVDLAAAQDFSVASFKAEILQAAGDTDAHPVTDLEQAVFLVVAASVAVVWKSEEAVAEALVSADGIAAVKRATTTDGIPKPVVERPDAGACHIRLDGILPPGIVGHFAEVPGLSVKESVRIDRLYRCEGFFHITEHMVAHEVEAETGDLVMVGPGYQ